MTVIKSAFNILLPHTIFSTKNMISSRKITCTFTKIEDGSQFLALQSSQICSTNLNFFELNMDKHSCKLPQEISAHAPTKYSCP